jgi:hypothetical protein
VNRIRRVAPTLALGAGIVAISAASFAACGDDDDDGEVPANTGTTEMMTDTTEAMTDTTEAMTDTTEMMTDTTGG